MGILLLFALVLTNVLKLLCITMCNKSACSRHFSRSPITLQCSDAGDKLQEGKPMSRVRLALEKLRVYRDERLNFAAALNEADSLWRSSHLIAAPLEGPLMSPHFLTDAWQSRRRRRRRLEGAERLGNRQQRRSWCPVGMEVITDNIISSCGPPRPPPSRQHFASELEESVHRGHSPAPSYPHRARFFFFFVLSF